MYSLNKTFVHKQNICKFQKYIYTCMLVTYTFNNLSHWIPFMHVLVDSSVIQSIFKELWGNSEIRVHSIESIAKVFTTICTRTNPITLRSLLFWWRNSKYKEIPCGLLRGNRQTEEISADGSVGQIKCIFNQPRSPNYQFHFKLRSWYQRWVLEGETHSFDKLNYLASRVRNEP